MGGNGSGKEPRDSICSHDFVNLLRDLRKGFEIDFTCSLFTSKEGRGRLVVLKTLMKNFQ